MGMSGSKIAGINQNIAQKEQMIGEIGSAVGQAGSSMSGGGGTGGGGGGGGGGGSSSSGTGIGMDQNTGNYSLSGGNY